MNKESQDRLHRLEEEAKLEHKIAKLSGGSGNRQFEATLGALNTLERVRKVLGEADDETRKIFTGYFIRDILLHKLAWWTITTPGAEYPYIGDLEELQKEKGSDFKIEIFRELAGTRRAILEAFLQYKKAKKAI